MCIIFNSLLALNPVFDFRKEFKYTLRAKEVDVMHKKLVKITVTDYDRVSLKLKAIILSNTRIRLHAMT